MPPTGGPRGPLKYHTRTGDVFTPRRASTGGPWNVWILTHLRGSTGALGMLHLPTGGTLELPPTDEKIYRIFCSYLKEIPSETAFT